MTADVRLAWIEQVRALLAEDPRVDGLVVVGSGAVGFRDELSDVDLVAAISSGLDVEAVGDELADRLRSALPLYRYLQTAPARALGLHVFLLEGQRELDLSFVATEELRAKDPRWRVAFDRSGEVLRRMSLPMAEPADRGEAVRFHYLAGCGSLWFGMKALQRGEHLQACDRLGEVRAHAAALACLERFGSDRKPAARQDELPAEDRERLSHLGAAAAAPDLTRAFRAALAALSHYDRVLLRGELGDEETGGLAEWLAQKYGGLL